MTGERRSMRRLALIVAALALWPASALAATSTGVVVRERAESPSLLGAVVSRAAPLRFDMVGFRWQGSGGVQFRARSVSGRWSGWQSVASSTVGDAGPREPYWVGVSDRLEYRSRGDVQGLRASYVWSAPLAVPPSTVSVAGSPPIVPRSAWGARESMRRARPLYAPSIKLVIVHHTAGANGYSRAASAAIVRGIYAYHVRANGWNDIGYNFLVDRYGQVFEGRYGGMDRNVVGAHAAGFNRGSVGIAVIGSFGSSSITPAARAALARLIAWRLDVAHVDPVGVTSMLSAGNERFRAGKAVALRVVSGHRDTGSTACPGGRLEAELPTLARAAASIGLPKLYAPRVEGKLGGSIRFRARLSGSLPWTVSVSDGETVVGSGSGEGRNVDWTWDSSGAGTGMSYRWTIAAEGARPAVGSLGGTKPVPPPSPPPPPPPAPGLLADLAVDPPVVSPNGDGVGDRLTVSYSLREPAAVTVSLLDGSGTATELARQEQQAGPQTLDLSLDAVADGSYRLEVVAESAGEQAELSVPIAVSRVVTSFALAGSAFSPNGDRQLDRLLVEFELVATVKGELSVLRDGAAVATLLAGTLSKGPQSLVWDGVVAGAVAADGDYELRLATGEAGAQAELRLGFRIDTQPPELAVVSWSPLRLRLSEAAHVVALVNGRRHELDAGEGIFTLPARAAIRSLRVVATDTAGNRLSRQLR